MSIPSLIGYGGVALVLLGYALLASGRITNADWRYPALNIVASLGIAYSLLFEWNLPSMVTQLVWIAISLVGLMRIAKKKGA